MSSKIFLDNKYFVGDVKEVTEGAAWISNRRTLWQQQNQAPVENMPGVMRG